MLSASSMEVERPQKTVSQNTRVFSKSGTLLRGQEMAQGEEWEGDISRSHVSEKGKVLCTTKMIMF